MKPNFVQTLTRGAREYRCPKCAQICLRGLDDDKCAGVAIVDTRPVGPLGELDALMRGRATYSLFRAGGQLELDYRDDYRIKGRPAGTPNIDVLVEHVCGSVPSQIIESAHKVSTYAVPSECPF